MPKPKLRLSFSTAGFEANDEMEPGRNLIFLSMFWTQSLMWPNKSAVLRMTGQASEREDFDIELGYIVNDESYSESITLSDGNVMSVRDLPGVETMATIVRVGTPQESHMAWSGLGIWAEANGYRFTGSTREVILDVPTFDEDILNTKFVTEIQVPIEKIPSDGRFLRTVR